MSSLPEDIQMRVPVKSTLVCKCVCKTWFSLISDPDFVKLHLNHTTKTNNCSLMLETHNPYSLYSVSYDSLASSYGSVGDVVINEIESPYEYFSNKIIKLLGSCNGLVYGWNYQLQLFFLWNPATKESKRLPKLDAYEAQSYQYHGFGYDYKTDDYRLVSKDNIYSLKSNSWESFQCPIWYRYGHDPELSGVFFNGALHWLASIETTTSNESSRMLVSVDMSEKRYTKLSLPSTRLPLVNMGVLEGCLCALADLDGRAFSQKTFEVWIMQDYGVPDSWTKLHTIAFDSAVSTPYYTYYLKPIGSLLNGEILFMNPYLDNVILYDPKYGTARNPKIQGFKIGGAVSNFESLVSLNPITAVRERKECEISR